MTSLLGRTVVELFASDSPAWMHSGVAVAASGEVVVAAPEGDALLVLGASGPRRVPTPTTELHGITRDVVDGTEVFWVADNGHKYVPATPVYADHRVGARLLAIDLDGVVRSELSPPAGPWSPTAVAVHDDLVWVADGYGQSLLHAFDRSGTCVLTVDGTDSGQPLECPHGIVVDHRGDRPVLVVADRANQRLVELDLDGTWRRTFGEGTVFSPSGLAIDGDLLLVTELWGDLVVLDADGALVDRVGVQPVEPARPGWPNAMADGVMVRPGLTAGTLNSPHGIAVDTDGSWLLTEWCIGGRVTRFLTEGPR